MISKLILALMLSASFRTANIENCPSDYEYMAGVKAVENNNFEVLHERENGERYDGLNFTGNYKYLTSYVIYKEAKSIDTQSFGATYPLGKLKFGGALNSNKWNNGDIVGLVKYDDEYVNISFEVNSRIQVFKSKVSCKHYIQKKVYLEPILTFNSFTNNNEHSNYYQAKMRVCYEL